jgi:hypothetical protein
MTSKNNVEVQDKAEELQNRNDSSSERNSMLPESETVNQTEIRKRKRPSRKRRRVM